MVSAYENALKRLWVGLCDVFIRETTVNPANGRDEPSEVQKIRNEPCRISFGSVSSTGERDEAPTVQQTVKLFVSKDVEIPAGSKIIVTQNGVTTSYTRSGQPAVYRYHQEVPLELFEEWA